MARLGLLWACLWTAYGVEPTVQLAWDPSPGAMSYRLYQSLNGAAWALAVSVTGTNATVAAAPGTTRYYVTAWSLGWESQPSNMVTNTVVSPPPTNPPPAMPEPPFGLGANAISGNRVDLGWGVKDLGTVSRVEQQLDGGPWALLAVVPAGTTHLSVQVKKHRLYGWRVQSCYQGGLCSGPSNTALFSWQ